MTAAVMFSAMQGKKGVWIKLPKQLSNLVDPAIKVEIYISSRCFAEFL